MGVQRVEALLEALEHQVVIGAHLDTALLTVESPCPGWTVREVLNHSIGVTLKFADFASGVSDNPKTPRGDLVGLDHRAALRETADAARSAWSTADMERMCYLSFGTYSSDMAAGVNLFDVLAHTWDIATGVGAELDCADDLWNTGLKAARDLIGGDRDPIHYGLEIPVGPSASPRARFLGYLGRTDGA